MARITTPTETLLSRPVYMVTIPAQSGYMGVLADHASTIAQLKPGLITVHSADAADVTARYFTSGGFAITKNSELGISVADAVKVEELDIAAARKGLL